MLKSEKSTFMVVSYLFQMFFAEGSTRSAAPGGQGQNARPCLSCQRPPSSCPASAALTSVALMSAGSGGRTGPPPQRSPDLSDPDLQGHPGAG